MPRQRGLSRGLARFGAWGTALLACWMLALLLLQALFGRQLERIQTLQLGRDLALNIRLAELTLERYPPALISELTGLELQVSERPAAPGRETQASAQRRQELKQVLCSRLSHCRVLRAAPSRAGTPEVWIELFSPLEPVWLRTPLPMARALPPPPTLLLLALVGAVVMTGVLYLLLDVARPLRKLEDAVSRVGGDTNRDPVPEEGSAEVRRISRRFNAMVTRLAEGERERATMLAGIAHDLRAPLTRLQFRLSMPELNAEERTRCQSDLEALERITGQFLLYAGGGEREECVACPLDQWLAEAVAGHPKDQLKLELSPIHLRIRPVALSRAVSNLVDNAFNHGNTPVVVRLRKQGAEVTIEVWDQGKGMPTNAWERALQPFQRLDSARGRQGHCGLGLAIVNHVVRTHAGRLSFRQGNGDPGRFAVIINLPLNETKEPDIP
ncbi:ATP-binding protein [Synechococcus sp. CC9605]|uniref:ATP-binding protein n=1 Tax=Synechococcus sp. (strain CC9605) TaxID=110662 RepID=UPI00005D5C56|nr:ATP-binding protein [Synechococcus sp. CC9605]ABB35585.1 periplasmic sensor signal transduction histidine kinase [Synechococcus sp. CC9605]